MIFVVQDIQIIRTDWQPLLETYGNIFILISSERLRKQSLHHKNYFSKTIYLSQINEQSVLAEINNEIVSTVSSLSDTAQTRLLITNDEYCLSLVNTLNQRFGNDVYEQNTLDCYLNKIKMKDQLRGSEIVVPNYIHCSALSHQEIIDSVKQKMKFPVIGKPTQEANNRGVKILESNTELTNWLEKNKQVDLEIEEFIHGTLYHCNSAIIDGVLQTLIVGEYLNPCLDFSLGKPIGSIFLQTNSPLYQEIAQFNEKIITKLGKLNHRVFHLELFRKKNGELVFLEIAARAPGGLLAQAAKHVIGIDLEQLNFRLQIDHRVTIPRQQSEMASFWCWAPKRPGKVLDLKIPSLQSKFNWQWYVASGEYLTKEASENAPACGVIAWNDCYDPLLKDFYQLQAYRTPINSDINRESVNIHKTGKLQWTQLQEEKTTDPTELFQKFSLN
jgi:D-ala D-ala ligase C-terminus